MGRFLPGVPGPDYDALGNRKNCKNQRDSPGDLGDTATREGAPDDRDETADVDDPSEILVDGIGLSLLLFRHGNLESLAR